MSARTPEPKIVVLACSWYPLTAIDNAGEDGCQYAPSTTVVPLECGGSLSTAAVLRAFAGSADGVLVAVCGAGDCHYANGNDSCEEVVEQTRELMTLVGLEPERLRIELGSNVDGSAFASLVTAFAADVGRLNGGARAKRRRRATGKARPLRKPAGRKAGGRTTQRRKAAPKAKRGAKRASRAKSKRRARRRAAG